MTYKTSNILILCMTSFLASSLLAKPSASALYPSHCNISPASNHKSTQPPQKIIKKPFPDAVYLEADSGQIKTKGTSFLEGNVIIQQNNLQFNTDSANYNSQQFLINAQGNIVFSSSAGNTFKSDLLQYNLRKKSGLLENTKYTIGKDRARGSSKKIKLIDQDSFVLDNATFTTCPTGVNSWHLASTKIKINNK